MVDTDKHELWLQRYGANCAHRRAMHIITGSSRDYGNAGGEPTHYTAKLI